MTYLKYTGLLLAVAVGLSFQPATLAQTVVNWEPTGTGDWNTPTNWEDVGVGQNVPEATFGETARIDTGGTAQVTDTPAAVGGIAIDDGTVDVTGTGNLVTAIGGPPATTGDVSVAANGTLMVADAGSLSVGGALDLGGAFVADLTSATYDAVSVTGNASLGGAFTANFNGAPTAAGSSWNIIGAASFSGSFASVSSVGVTFPPGQGVGLQVVGGTTLQLAVVPELVLHFDRDTNIGSIQNLSSSTLDISFNGYSIASAAGSLNPAGWDSLEDQATDGGTWSQTGTGGTEFFLAELNPTTSHTLMPNQSIGLGMIHTKNFDNVAFGEDIDDHVFTYNTPTGQIVAAAVTYSGEKQNNNIVLTIDPSTGEGAMQNESELSVDFDLYTIFSESGALLTTYSSLDDQDVAGAEWREANLSANRLSEDMRVPFTTFDKNEGYGFGTLFNVGSAQDLTFQFLIAGNADLTDGIVVYGTLPTNLGDPDAVGLAGDYNLNGVVDAADYTVWRDMLGQMGMGLAADGDGSGTVDQADYDLWKANFGNTAGSGSLATAAVPEPAAVWLLMLGAAGLGLRSRQTA